MRISDWSSDVCSSDLAHEGVGHFPFQQQPVVEGDVGVQHRRDVGASGLVEMRVHALAEQLPDRDPRAAEPDRQSGVSGTSGSGRVDLGGRPINYTKTTPGLRLNLYYVIHSNTI